MVLELWGENLAPPGCGRDQIPKSQLPLELCGVQVLIDSQPAELMYVSSYQINLRIPPDAPSEGLVPFQVCVAGACSDPVPMRFSALTALLTLSQQAYVHMPVWIDVDAPARYVVDYPCGFWPWNFPGYEFEVLRDGQPLPPTPQPSPPVNRSETFTHSCDGPSASGRLPLHLLYRFDQPGAYSVRFTAKESGKILYSSDWTEIQIEPFSEAKREDWLRSLDPKLANGRSATEVVPSLLAWPDEKALAVLMKIIPATSGCLNWDCVRLAIGRAALAGFDESLLRREIPRDRLVQLCPPNGECK